MEVSWTVKLPDGHAHDGQACSDPAVEAALEGISSGPIDIFLWGGSPHGNAPYARVHYEVHEEDVTIEEDERGAK